MSQDPEVPASRPLMLPASGRRIEDLLREFVSRADELIETQIRMRGLLEAVVAMAGDLSLKAVLNQVVESACKLVNAQYGALGVLAEDGPGLKHFITVGIDDEVAEKIGDLPTGHGVLGLLISDPRPLRLPDLGRHPSAYGFPPGHPPMTSFLGVPIRVRHVVFGNLYLTDRTDGGEFTAEDEELVIALAAAAGVAIENARLFEDAGRRQQWREASMDVTGDLMVKLLDAPVDGMQLICERALETSKAALALIAIAGEGDAGMYCAAAAGDNAALISGWTLSADSPVLLEVLATGKSRMVDDVTEILGSDMSEGLASGLVAALGPRGPNQGILLLARRSGAERFPQVDVQMTGIFGSHVALSLELSRAHGLREQLAVFADRDRIARDLHDVVIQRLFAAGLSMQSLRRFTTEPVAHERINTVTAELDETIQELRNTIYSLRTTTEDNELLTGRLLRTVQEGARTLTFTPRIQFSGAIDLQVPQSVGEHLLAVLTEGLSNAVQHAQAGSIEISVSSDADFVELLIRDDGCGFSGTTRRSGLTNLEHRARQLNGALEIESRQGEGTKLKWSVPL